MFQNIVQDGFINTTTWQIVVKEDFDTYKKLLLEGAGNHDEEIRLVNAMISHRHEMIHFWQAFSTSFLYSFSIHLLDYSIDALRYYRSSDDKSEFSFEIIKPHFDAVYELMSISSGESDNKIANITDSVRSIDLIEGSAVFCSYRYVYRNGSHEKFLAYLKKNHFGQREYQSAYLVASSIIGEVAYNLFSPIIFLSLQGDNPGRNFLHILLYARDNLHLFKSGSNILDNLMKISSISYEGLFIATSQRNGVLDENKYSHVILKPYIELSVTQDIKFVADFFAQPYEYEDNKNKVVSDEQSSFIEKVQAPVQLFSGRKSLLLGLAQNLGKNYAITLHHLTSIIGMMPVLVYGAEEEMFCIHTDCPHYKMNLCNKYYAYPPEDFLDCKFPDILESMGISDLLK